MKSTEESVIASIRYVPSTVSPAATLYPSLLFHRNTTVLSPSIHLPKYRNGKGGAVGAGGGGGGGSVIATATGAGIGTTAFEAKRSVILLFLTERFSLSRSRSGRLAWGGAPIMTGAGSGAAR